MPEKNCTIISRVQLETKTAFQQKAAEHGLSESEFLRLIIFEAIDKPINQNKIILPPTNPAEKKRRRVVIELPEVLYKSTRCSTLNFN